MGMIFNKILKCENCGYEYRGKGGGHIISNGERYGISQFYCKTCHSIIDLECYSSLRENIEKYTYPDGTEVSYNIIKKQEELDSENAENSQANVQKDNRPLCQKCGDYLVKFEIGNNENGICPKCGHKSLKQKEIHVTAYID